MTRDAGFAILRLRESRPDAELVAARPELEDCARMPYFLIFEIGRGDAARFTHAPPLASAAHLRKPGLKALEFHGWDQGWDALIPPARTLQNHIT